MPLTQREAELRQQARALIDVGMLPREVPRSVSGGYGQGDKCALCSAPIGADEVEYELESGNQTYRFHFLCHAAWSLECARAEILASRAKTP